MLVGRATAPCTKALLCIDLTPAVCKEAIETGAQVIVAYHPVLFEERKTIADTDPRGALLLSVIEAGLGVVSPHTALDAAPDGLSDWLARGMGDGTTRPIEHSTQLPPSETVQLVTHVPRDQATAVREAMGEAGAGRLGAYDMCCTTIESSGSFRPGVGSNPVIGTQGTLEQIDECTLVMVCSTARLPDVIDALCKAHPYEEPPIHVVPLSPRPVNATGAGRLLMLDQPAAIETIAGRVKTHLGVDALRMAKASSEQHSIVACCPGAGGSMLGNAASQGATAFLTGEMRHHDLLEAQAKGISVLLAGHTNTERGYLPLLQRRLQKAVADIGFHVSKSDTTPWSTI